MAIGAEHREAIGVGDGYRWAMLGGVWLLYFCFGLIAAAMAPLIGPITGALDISHSAMGAILGAWPLVYVLLAIPCGALLDRFGLRRALALAALVIAASAVLRGLATSQVEMFLAVALFGVGGPLISIGAPKLISLWFSGAERGTAMGLYITGPALGNVAALALTNSVAMPLAGGDWRMVLIGYSGFVLAAGLVWLAITGHRSARAMERATGHETTAAQLKGFATLLGVRTVRLVLVFSFGIFFFNHALNNWLPEILRGQGMDATTAGYWASIPTAVGVIGALVVPRLATAARRRAILFALFLSAATAAMLLTLADDRLALGAALVLQGVARGTMTSVAVLVMMEAREVGASRMGSAGGLFFSVGEIGGVLGPLTIGVAFDATGGFTTGLWGLAGLCALCALMVGRLARPR
jgi:MFS transporter, CP family, cyanate transporter